ncbi:hypothetical protein AB838_20295 [Rhodobacteraceae bacterium (ex Bugula neritina AB1)]|nr:hypothetical protein AB838_20295 [Rhodobacteraceae bacterium (ex Bugula neritina AB1)]
MSKLMQAGLPAGLGRSRMSAMTFGLAPGAMAKPEGAVGHDALQAALPDVRGPRAEAAPQKYS